jgi:pimeloyl-ACP methyl ester carboxylesterase
MPDEWREAVLSRADVVAAEQPHEVTTRYPSSEQLRRLDMPVTIVIGERSQPYFHRIATHLQRLLPNVSVRSVAGASHGVHLDSPNEVAALLHVNALA